MWGIFTGLSRHCVSGKCDFILPLTYTTYIKSTSSTCRFLCCLLRTDRLSVVLGIACSDELYGLYELYELYELYPVQRLDQLSIMKMVWWFGVSFGWYIIDLAMVHVHELYRCGMRHCLLSHSSPCFLFWSTDYLDGCLGDIFRNQMFSMIYPVCTVWRVSIKHFCFF